MFQAPLLPLVAQQCAMPLQWVQLLPFLLSTCPFSVEGLRYFDPSLFPSLKRKSPTLVPGHFVSFWAWYVLSSGNWLAMLQMLGYAEPFSQPGVGRALPQKC